MNLDLVEWDILKMFGLLFAPILASAVILPILWTIFALAGQPP